MQNPTHFYACRKPCGCCVQVTTDVAYQSEEDAKWVAERIAEAIQNGLTVQRISQEEYRQIIDNEESLLKGCPHRVVQPHLLEVA